MIAEITFISVSWKLPRVAVAKLDCLSPKTFKDAAAVTVGTRKYSLV
jgi:hypothetical protein